MLAFEFSGDFFWLNSLFQIEDDVLETNDVNNSFRGQSQNS